MMTSTFADQDKGFLSETGTARIRRAPKCDKFLRPRLAKYQRINRWSLAAARIVTDSYCLQNPFPENHLSEITMNDLGESFYATRLSESRGQYIGVPETIHCSTVLRQRIGSIQEAQQPCQTNNPPSELQPYPRLERRSTRSFLEPILFGG